MNNPIKICSKCGEVMIPLNNFSTTMRCPNNCYYETSDNIKNIEDRYKLWKQYKDNGLGSVIQDTVTYKTISELIDEGDTFISVIPNNLGINLCSVEGIKYTRQLDGQLKSLEIIFIPNNN